MKIKVTDGVLISGKACRRGDVVDVDDKTARMLEQMGRAVPFIAAEPVVEPAKVEPGPVLETESAPFVKQHRHKKGKW